MPTTPSRGCITCFGTGEVGGDRGVEDCRDCHGTGRLGSGAVIAEERLRKIEAAAERLDGELQGDLRWLVFEVRKSRSALVQVLAAGQELDDDEALVKRIRFVANDALGLYETTPA